jgi:hypothetical protein
MNDLQPVRRRIDLLYGSYFTQMPVMPTADCFEWLSGQFFYKTYERIAQTHLQEDVVARVRVFIS